ncbi:MAG: response regulator [Campylobacterota bacterium]|nr:response regulator [Campylobacterota bacterium]
MKTIFFLTTLTASLFGQDSSAGYDIAFYGQFLVILLLVGYIIVSKAGIFGKGKRRRKGDVSVVEEITPEVEAENINVIEKYRLEMRKIKIDNQPFRISGLLHILTNKLSETLKQNGHTIYYDVQSDVGRYIIGDNDYIEQVLEIVLTNTLKLNNDAEISLQISKVKNKFLEFEITNNTGFMKSEDVKEYMHATRTLSTMSPSLLSFIKAKKIAEAMEGSIELKSSRISGTHYIFNIPYYEDKDNRSKQKELKKFLEGKRALFIGKDKYDTKRAQYIFQTYGIKIENMKLSDFEHKKPDLSGYDMAILRSLDITYNHISFFKNIYHDKNSNFKIIIVHELFEDEEKINLSKSIAHAELFNPTVIGDVEEILYQMFMLQSHAVKGINNMEIFDANTFVLKAYNKNLEENLENYRGAHVAVVEDSKVDQRIMRNILNIEGLVLFNMQNGEEMIELLEKEEIDLIFSDINMPVMDGLTMTKKIREVEKWRDIPIVSISSMAFGHEVKEMQLAGMNASIAKPIVVEEVHEALKRFIMMTPELQERRAKAKKTALLYSKEVLDIDTALKEADSVLVYQTNLEETIKILEEAKEDFTKMIYAGEYRALAEFSKSAIEICQVVHAQEMVKMFHELLTFVTQKQKIYLIEYAFLYKKNCKKLRDEIDMYLSDSGRKA